jgi:hypothetical protein
LEDLSIDEIILNLIFKKIRRMDVDWVHLAQDREQLMAATNVNFLKKNIYPLTEDTPSSS